jgi:hypothetical protein
MPAINVKFRDVPALDCRIDDTDLGHRYYTLVKSEYDQNPTPVFEDQKKYTLEYFKTLASQARKIIGWEWDRDNYDITVTTQLHKDIETFLGQGFDNISEEAGTLAIEIHRCLHSIESPNQQRGAWLQIEWQNGNGFPITSNEYPAKLGIEFGDIRLQNPYVGHHPLFLYEQKDTINVTQTCRFHDFVKPGINIVITDRGPAKPINKDVYLNWFKNNAAEFVQQKGLDELWKFTGHPIVGHVDNLDILTEVLSQPLIGFESLTFKD